MQFEKFNLRTMHPITFLRWKHQGHDHKPWLRVFGFPVGDQSRCLLYKTKWQSRSFKSHKLALREH